MITVAPAYDAPFKGQVLADRVEATLARHPAVRSVALAANVYPLLSGSIGGKLAINGGEPLDDVWAHGHGVTSAYFRTLGITLTEGRFFGAKAPTSQVVLDERFAKRFWPWGKAVGSRFGVGSAGYAGVYEWEVVGVARHVRPDRLTADSGRDLFVFYYPMVPPRSSVSAVLKLEDAQS